MTEHTLNKSDLMQFTGSEQWYRHGINRKVLFTDGAKHVADAGGAFAIPSFCRAIFPFACRNQATNYERNTP